MSVKLDLREQVTSNLAEVLKNLIVFIIFKISPFISLYYLLNLFAFSPAISVKLQPVFLIIFLFYHLFHSIFHIQDMNSVSAFYTTLLSESFTLYSTHLKKVSQYDLQYLLSIVSFSDLVFFYFSALFFNIFFSPWILWLHIIEHLSVFLKYHTFFPLGPCTCYFLYC